MRGFRLGVSLALALGCAHAHAQDAVPGQTSAACGAFDWPLRQEQAWFLAPGLPKIASGGSLPVDAPGASLDLEPFAEAHLPNPPTRAPKPDTFAGVLRVSAPIKPGQYQITLSDEGWIDVVQEGGGPRNPTAHTGKRGCPGLRKSLRYQLGSKPFSVTISNVGSAAIKIAVAPVE